MTNNSDDVAFEEWFVNHFTKKDLLVWAVDNREDFKETWKAALKYKQEEFQRMENAWREKLRYETVRLSRELNEERKRSEKLVNALEFIATQTYGRPSEMMLLARVALKEYKSGIVTDEKSSDKKEGV